MLISTYFKENANAARAEVLKNEAGGYYYIDYYDAGGNRFYTEAFPINLFITLKTPQRIGPPT